MNLSDKSIKEFKKILEKKKGTEVSWEEASKGAYNLVGFAELMYKFWIEDQHRQKKLEQSPKVFI